MRSYGSSSRALVVDDDAVVSRLVATTLAREGFGVDVARTCAAGIEILRGRACAVAFIDWRLGGEDGLEIVRLASGEGIPTRLVLMTGYPDAECSAEVVRLGAAYLIKPIAMDVLAAIARGAIARHRFSEAVSPSGIFAGPPHARLAKAIVAVVDAPRDVLTIDAWGELSGPSGRTIESWCLAAGVRAHDVLTFARCLRAVFRTEVYREPFGRALDSVDPRTRRHLVEVAGGDRRTGAAPTTVSDFLDGQGFLRDASILLAVRSLLRNH